MKGQRQENKKHLCPVFPDLICPQGRKMSEACTVRINGDFDPMENFHDYLLLHCAIFQNMQQTLK